MAGITKNELDQVYLQLVRDANFDKLELALNEPNIFSILSIEHMEIRHSNFLGWLLNPRESHGLNDLFLKRFLREVFSDEKVADFNALHAESLDFLQVEVLREWRNIDLLLKFPTLVICIENKVKSKDHSGQLKNYKQVIHEEFSGSNYKHVFIYLTPYGESSSQEQDVYAFISYQIIIEILDRILEVYAELIPNQSIVYIKDYIKSLRRNLMSTDSTNEIAREIYKKHQRILDFIIENKPDYLDGLSKILEDYLVGKNYIIGSRNKGAVRFYTQPLVELIAYDKKAIRSFPKKESFLFELDFRGKDKLIFKIIAAPSGPDTTYRDKLVQIVKTISWVKGEMSSQWSTFISKNIKVEIEELTESNPQAIVDKIEKGWPAIDQIIKDFEEALLNHKEDLIALKHQVEN